MSPAMNEVGLALDKYRDAVELRAVFEAATRDKPKRYAIKLAAMRDDERAARHELETAFALALDGLAT